jgi:flagellar basal body-associated protein FliL
MAMKRFLILSILIVFVTVSCASPSKVRWTKPDFHQDQLEKDREDCIQAVKDDPEQKMTVEECLAKKGYESEPESPSDEENAKNAETAKKVGKVLLATGGIIVLGALAVGLIGMMAFFGI